MKKRITRLLPVMIILIIAMACGVIIENDISKKKVVLLSPGDTVNLSNVNFVWDEIDDALVYRLQIATPSFNNLGQILIDTLQGTTSFKYEMAPGNYEWRVRAENNGYETEYSEKAFVVGVDQDLTGQDVVLSSPLNNTKINDTTGIEFVWDKIQAADYYRIQIFTEKGGVTQTIRDGTVTDNSTFQDFPSRNATYRWRVRAENNTSSTKFSKEWQFDIDTANLNKPVFRE